MARPTKFDPATAAVILKAVADGLPNQTAAHLAGITERTLYHWLRRGRAGEEPFLQFLQDVKKAGAEAVVVRVGQIHQAAASGTWQAAAWWLERRHPDLYGSDRKRVRELVRLVAELTRKVSGGGAEHVLVIGGEADPARLGPDPEAARG